jgi:histidinol-phosphate/aromatic aminotransferase/cobyric acid decarboxylase-like protein
MSKSRALAGLRVGYALVGVRLIDALHRVKNNFDSYPLGRCSQAAATASVHHLHDQQVRMISLSPPKSTWASSITAGVSG